MKFPKQVNELIAELRGVPADKSRARDRPTTAIGNLVEVILQKHRLGKVSVEDSIMARWRDIVGEQSAHRCRPLKIIDGRQLIIVTTNAVLRQELMFRKTDILRKVREIPECSTIRELVIRTG